LVFTQDKTPADNWATLDGNKIRYYDIGNMKTRNAIVFVHGWTCNADFWRESLYAYPGYRIIAIDLPGHGKSDKPKLDYTMEHFARSIDAVMKKAGVRRAVLAGHSMGTPVIRQYYRIYPEKTLGIIAVDGALVTFGTSEEMKQFFDPIFINYSENAVKFVDSMLEPIKDASMKKTIRESMLATPEHVAVSAIKGMIDEMIWTKDQIKVPVLAWMAQSPFWPADIKEQFQSVAPNLDFEMRSGVSHFLMMEEPAMFNSHVKGFILQNKLL
jgi:pimeloyl-ACP methyl ester carboxylesterase